MKTISALLFSIGLAIAAIAIAPSGAILENDQVKVVRALEKPHVKGKFHDHKTNRVMIYLQAGSQRFEYQDGRKPAVFDYKAGEVKWSPMEGMHAPEVVSDQPFNIIEVELKKPGTGKKIVTERDPPKLDPQHVKVEFENDQVRVLRAHLGPHESIPLHQHLLNRVTVFLTDQNILSTDAPYVTAHTESFAMPQTQKHKAGDVIWGTPLTHEEKNMNDAPYEVVVVEIKD